MILIISTILCALIITAAVYNKDELYLVYLIFPIVLGYGLLGIIIPMDNKIEHKVISSLCSAEFGECKLIVGSDVYNVNDYKVVDWFIKNPHPTPYQFTTMLNSYGWLLSTSIRLPNDYIFRII